MSGTLHPPENPVLEPGYRVGLSDLQTPPPDHGIDSAKTVSNASLSQWQLIRRRFAKHRPAVASLYLLTILYLLAVFAEFFAPYTPGRRDLERTYAPPQPLRFSFTHGLHAYAMERHMDPITFRRYYTADPDAIIPVSFIVEGEPYRLWGLIPMDIHFFGVSSARDAAEETEPTFYLLGTDQYGHDLLSRIVYGARISLSVGLAAILVTFVLGLFFGGISGYVGGKTDAVIQRGIEIINSFPHLPLWLALAAAMPSEWSPLFVYFMITLVLSLLGWTGLARVVRGKILSLREEDYATAARLLGAGHGRILFRHLIPGFTSHIIVALTLSVPGMILGETALSFLGLGLRPPIVSWGVMLQDCMNISAVADYPWLLLPAVFIVLTVLCFNFIGDGMRDAADPYST